MTNENNNQNKGYYIPKQWRLNIPETVTVAYYTPEEATITPLVQDGVYRSPKIEEVDPSYGPCPLSDDDKKAVKGIGTGAAVATGIITLICPPLGATIGTTLAISSGVAAATQHIVKNEDLKDWAEAMSISQEIAAKGSAAGGFANKATVGKCLGHIHK